MTAPDLLLDVLSSVFLVSVLLVELFPKSDDQRITSGRESHIISIHCTKYVGFETLTAVAGRWQEHHGSSNDPSFSLCAFVSFLILCHKLAILGVPPQFFSYKET